MLELFLSGGILMYPILLCSIIALAIVAERLWTLRRQQITPDKVLPTLLHNYENRQITKQYLSRVSKSSPLGMVLVKGMYSLSYGHEMVMLKMNEQGRHCLHELERYLNTLGTIAAITPLIGLLGTVTGMIEVFNVITQAGPTNPELLAGGISQALLTTAFGLSVAIPSLMFHRHFHRKIDEFAITFEQEAAKLVEYCKESKNKSTGEVKQAFDQRVA